MKNNEYKCAMCGNIYNKGWSDEEAMAESKSYFGAWKDEDLEVVCNDCFNKMHPEKYPELANEAKRLSNLQQPLSR